MMEVRLTSGLKAGEVIEVDDHVAQAFLVSGKAEPVESEVVEVAAESEVIETPEKPARRGRRKAAEAPETR